MAGKFYGEAVNGDHKRLLLNRGTKVGEMGYSGSGMLGGRKTGADALPLKQLN
jgi:hypothetical protein